MEKKNEQLDRLIDKAMDAAKVPASDFAFTENVMAELRAEQAMQKSVAPAKPMLSVRFKLGMVAVIALILVAALFNWSVGNFSVLDKVQVPDFSIQLPTWQFSDIWLYGFAAFFMAFVVLVFSQRQRSIS